MKSRMSFIPRGIVLPVLKGVNDTIMKGYSRKRKSGAARQLFTKKRKTMVTNRYAKGKGRPTTRRWISGGKRKRPTGGFNRPKGKFANKVKQVVMNQIASENSYLENYIDVVTTAAEAKDAEANQIMWAVNQASASGGLVAGTRYNMVMHDPAFLSNISQNIEAVQTTKATIKTYATSCKLVNAGTAPLTIWEYRCRARNDYQSNLQTLVTGGFSDSNTGIGTKPTSTTLGATVFQNPALCSAFKVTKVRRWNLKPAQTKWIKYVAKKDFQFTQERIAPDGNIKSILKGKSMSVFVMQGSFGYLGSNTDGKRYGIVAPNLGIEYYTKIHYSWIKDDSVAHGYVQNMTGLTSNGTIGGGNAHVPMPIVINHPDSSVADGTGARTAATTDAYDVETVKFNVN